MSYWQEQVEEAVWLMAEGVDTDGTELVTLAQSMARIIDHMSESLKTRSDLEWDTIKSCESGT